MIPNHFLSILIFLVLLGAGAMLVVEGITDFFVLFARTVGATLRGSSDD